VAFTAVASGRVSQGEYDHTSSTQTSPRIQSQRTLLSGSPYLPAPRVGSGLHLGGFGSDSMVGLNELNLRQNILSFLTLVSSISKPAHSIRGRTWSVHTDVNTCQSFFLFSCEGPKLRRPVTRRTDSLDPSPLLLAASRYNGL
jgi:hypothetical protein